MTRRIFIGDIQGCRVELERLLEAVRFDSANDEVHPVGDLVNRGPDSAGCLRVLRSIDAGGVLGNHDLHLLHTAAGSRSIKTGDTIQDVLDADDRDELVAWLAGRPFVRAFDGAVLVHAGFGPTWTDPVGRLADADPYAPDDDALFAVRARRCNGDGRMGKRSSGAKGEFRPWHAFHDPARIGNRTLVFGHWASQGLLVRDGLRGLDSGCVWGKELSAWIAEEDRIVQVPAERAYAEIGE